MILNLLPLTISPRGPCSHPTRPWYATSLVGVSPSHLGDSLANCDDGEAWSFFGSNREVLWTISNVLQLSFHGWAGRDPSRGVILRRVAIADRWHHQGDVLFSLHSQKQRFSTWWLSRISSSHHGRNKIKFKINCLSIINLFSSNEIFYSFLVSYDGEGEGQGEGTLVVSDYGSCPSC